MVQSIFDDIGFETANDLMGKAIADVARETARLGLPEAVKVNGVWVAQYPDGRVAPLAEALNADPL
jgi:hypothetical protein